MKVSVESQDPRNAKLDLLAVPLPKADPKRWKLRGRAATLDRALGGGISKAISSGDFQGRAGDSTLIYPGVTGAPKRVLLLGLGEEGKLDAEALRRLAGRAVRVAIAKKAAQVGLAAPAVKGTKPAAVAGSLAEGAVLGAYRFDGYKEAPKEGAAQVRSFKLFTESKSDLRGLRKAASEGVALAESQNVARDLSNEPANELPPAQLAKAAQKVAREVGLRCRVMEVPELKRRKMGALLAVGQGSANPPRMVVLEHNPPKRGAKTRRATLCVVGKGITFDSGGISIKPSAGMQDMKHDMSGAAAVVGIMRAVALLKLPHHVVGVIAAAENMPSGTAYRPGDIIRSMSGKTIEILNTDAEGRVVLADALHYANKEFKPRAMVDLATLTGACMVALGPWATGLFSTDAKLTEQLREAGEAAGERAWPMPLLEEHKQAMRSTVADLKNAGGRDAGASTAAGFLAAFVGETPWAHLDIAGTGWTEKNTPTQIRGGTGVGVRMITEWLRRWS